MAVFGNYSHYYDLLYRDKDYVSEATFIHDLIQNHTPNAKSTLELGCGTGRHAILLAEIGYSIHGVDFSQEMLQKAQERLTGSPVELLAKLQFSHGDIRQINLQQYFDVILSLFHVMSYQTTPVDFLAVLQTVKTHLKKGGIFIFDVWYGPAVLSDPPRVRVKRLEDGIIKVTRVAEPNLYPNENLVDVNYQVFIQDQQSGSIDELRETHQMRYWFKSEIELLIESQEFSLIESGEWLTRQRPGLDTWGVYFIIKS